MRNNREHRRELMQKELDSCKSDRERNILGQYSTPFLLACDIVKYVLSLRNPDDPIRFLEPSIGTGVFYSALTEYADVQEALGFEIDAHYYRPSSQFWSDSGLRIIHGDFFEQMPRSRFNLILANPPYTRHHHLDSGLKQRLRERVLSQFGIGISGLCGLYCYFMILSSAWLEQEGISSWLIPSEVLDVNYGEGVKRFLTDKVELISIHRFDPEDVQFSDALVSSAVVTFRNSKRRHQDVVLSSGGSMYSPRRRRVVSIDDMDAAHKWTPMFSMEDPIVEGLPLGHYFKVSRGIASGNNSFFILSEDEVVERDLPKEFLQPILPPPRNLKETRIMEDGSNLKCRDRYYLLSCPLSLDEIKGRYASLYRYVVEGEKRKVNEGYNCSRRKPWYCCELRTAAPIYMTYMGRGGDGSDVFRFILNESASIVTNSYLMLYPRNEYKYCFSDAGIRSSVWRILNGIPKKRLTACGRSYGGGLFKIEPKELESLRVPELEDVLKPLQKSLFDQ